MLHKLALAVPMAMLIALIPTYSAVGQDAAALTGLWRFDVTSPLGTTLGAMTIRSKDRRYSGKVITDQGDEAHDIRSVELSGDKMTIMVTSPHGDIIFRGDLANAGQRFNGTISYYNGQSFPMIGVKQQVPTQP